MINTPASILYDVNGNPIGVLYDGAVYRLKVDAVLTDGAGNIADVEQVGTRSALAVEYPLLLKKAEEILGELRVIRRHIQSITEEEWDEDDND